MADETTQFILGDAAVDALGQSRKRRFFSRRNRHEQVLTNCENCEAPLTGAYCAQCGQHAIDYHRSLLRVAVDAADSFFNWDTKFLKSVGVLLLWPWRLTNDFNAGRRVRYVHPLRLYLLASIAFFLVVKLVNLDPGSAVHISTETRAEVDGALAKLTAEDSKLTPEQRAKVEALRTRWSETAATEPQTPEQRGLSKIAQRMPGFAEKSELRPKDLARLQALLDRVPAVPTPAPPPADPADGGSPPELTENSTAPPQPPPQPVIHTKLFGNETDGSDSPFGRWIEARVKEKIGTDGVNAKLFLDTLRNNIPTMMLCCIPLFAFVLKVLYVRQRRYYVDHLVYALHIHTFVYVAAVVITLLGMAVERSLPVLQPIIASILSFVAFGMVFVSIRRVYRQGWFVSTFKFVVGGIAYFVVLVLAVTVTALITLMMP
ncbi:MAG: DUF3667 domain-containing protein [Chthoniobacterales bacterium]